ncbi:hypothetical protein DBV39_05210 [Orrella marina]|uniref:DNA polymerase Y family protein n=2 Tax=Orrella marina TaxID=2163011 RepID=A0A2R4XH99_9BURK|nr:hypothetical protein DBV39_05210 [Orrella marina]
MFWIAIRPPICPESVRTTLTRIALDVTSQCVWHDRDTLLMDVTASVRLFGGLRSLRAELRRTLMQELGGAFSGVVSDPLHGDTVDEVPAARTASSAQVACGPITVSISISAMGAWLLAQSHVKATRVEPFQHWQQWYYALSLGRLRQLTDALPVSRLPVCKPYLKWFQGIGCTSIGALRRLPRAQLQARTEVGVLAALDQVDALAVWPYRSCEMPEHFVVRRSLDEPVQHAGLLQVRLHPLLQQMCQWLQQHHWAASVWEVRLFHAGRRKRQPPSRLRLAMAEPGWHFEHLAYLLDVRLQAWQLPAPVTDLMVLSHTVEPRQLHNPSLFADDLTRQQDLRRTLDTLRTRLGDDAIRIVAPRPDYRPERANHWCRADTTARISRSDMDSVSSDVSGRAPATVVSEHHSPSWLLHAPQALSIRDDRPWRNGGPLQLLYGPYRVETGWWDHQPVQRDYFVACDPQARHYWIYRERTREGLLWYLHGLFG